MDSLIPLLNKIQDAFSLIGEDAPLSLPQIAVVGSQSAGKSSVLETIVGQSFLPRGSGIVTRRPCVIQLHSTPGSSAEYGTFLHDLSERKFNFDEICHEIVAETERECGKNKGISSKPITLRIYSPNVINLTLIDLPGATRVPVGDQPSDIGRQIEDLVMSYISKPNCIILAISAANTDLANSDAILFAKRVDPSGERTLGVLTKLDLMDKGTDAKGIFTGESSDVPKLKLGYIGVVNRSQDDINKKVPIEKARKEEMNYFRNHQAYRSFSEVMGTDYLVKKCSQMLIDAIQKALPEISSQLSEILNVKSKLLSELPEDNQDNLRTLLVEMIVTFTDRFKRLLKGDTGLESSTRAALTGGSRIEAIFKTIYSKEINNMAVLESLTPADVQALIHNVRGLGGGLFTPDEVVIAMIRQQIERFEKPALKCSKLIYNELILVLHKAISQVPKLQTFSNCSVGIQKIVQGIFQNQFNSAQTEIKLMIKMELQRINFSHPEFIGRNGAMKQIQEQERLAASGGVGGTSTLGGPIRNASQLPNQGAYELEQKSSKNKSPASNNNNTNLSEPASGGGGFGDIRARFGKSTLYSKSNAAGTGATNPTNSIVIEGVEKSLTDEVNSKLKDFLTQISPEERTEIDMLIRITQSYFGIVKKNQQDIVPKAINYILVTESLDTITTTLLTQLTSEGKVTQLMAVNEEAKQRRKKLVEEVKLLEQAERVLTEDIPRMFVRGK